MERRVDPSQIINVHKGDSSGGSNEAISLDSSNGKFRPNQAHDAPHESFVSIRPKVARPVQEKTKNQILAPGNIFQQIDDRPQQPMQSNLAYQPSQPAQPSRMQ